MLPPKNTCLKDVTPKLPVRAMRKIWTYRFALGVLGVIILCAFVWSQEKPSPTLPEKKLASLKRFSAGSRPPIRKAHENEWGVQPKAQQTQRLEELARTDHITLLKWALTSYEKNVWDYTATFYKQERIKGKLKPQQKISVYFKEKPFSLFMKWRKNSDSIDKLLYVEGQHNNQMIVHPTGIFSWIKSVKRNPRGKDARKSSLKSCEQFGFHRNLQSLLKVYEQAQKKNDLQTNYLGPTRVLGRRCVAIERRLPARKNYPNARMVVEFDVEYVLPIALTSYDWKGKLISRYVYGDLTFNHGLTNKTFLPKTNKM